MLETECKKCWKLNKEFEPNLKSFHLAESLLRWTVLPWKYVSNVQKVCLLCILKYEW